MLVALPAIAAPSKDTAGGVQTYLARMTQEVVTKVYFVDAQERTNYVTGKYSGDVKTSKISNIARTKEELRQLPEQLVDKQLWDVRAVTLDAIDAEGRPNECATRITAVTASDYDETKSDVRQENATFSYKLITTSEQWKYEPLTKFTTPAQVIEWRNAHVSRSPDSQITVTSRGQAFPKIQLSFAAGDLDLADRIEYAMKFLLMSCSESAGHGS
ncbi:MAG TPA: hypothetical protein VFU13_22930 [Steroidobacteraceae bacterium]|nr:hypothetical protein [Steroidobacteraceae bacterium]